VKRRGIGRHPSATYKPRFKGKKVLLITGCQILVGSCCLQEAAIELVGQREEIDKRGQGADQGALMGQDAHMIDDMTPREMYKMLKEREG